MYPNNPDFFRQNDVRIADISHHGPKLERF